MLGGMPGRAFEKFVRGLAAIIGFDIAFKGAGARPPGGQAALDVFGVNGKSLRIAHFRGRSFEKPGFGEASGFEGVRIRGGQAEKMKSQIAHSAIPARNAQSELSGGCLKNDEAGGIDNRLEPAGQFLRGKPRGVDLPVNPHKASQLRRIPSVKETFPVGQHGHEAQTAANELVRRGSIGFDINRLERDPPGRKQLFRFGTGASAGAVIKKVSHGCPRGLYREEGKKVHQRGRRRILFEI